MKRDDKGLQCSANLVSKEISGEISILKSSDHNHGPDVGKAEAEKKIQELKDRAKATSERPAIVIQDTLTSCDETTYHRMPSAHSLRLMILKERKSNFKE